MDRNVIRDLKAGFCHDLYETVKAARKNRDEKVFRHTMFQDGEVLVFAAVYPKQELMQFPDMSEDFAARLKTFNLLGVATNSENSLDLFFLGGMNKPFTSAANPNDLSKVIEDESLAVFLEMYFQARGVDLDFRSLDYDAFLAAVQGEVFKNTSFSKLADVDALLRQMGS
ncbi:hypothetical protein [Pseudodesulfovibrio tunisiensis]|uniref:hypothetical protein n=1 Tax=Pseudodesulfovibrio tunisiensis TaxID=463192 RepID=UPI001FB1D85D|nr:hypothetical protein [Pseudodesulfovibrio tunisiensis]